MIKLLDENYSRELTLSIHKGKLDNFKKIIEENNVDPNSFVDEKFYTPLLNEVLTSIGLKDEEMRLEMLTFLLERGANPNIKGKDRYNALHIAACYKKLTKALHLFLDFNGDVNITDAEGMNVLFFAIQNFSWVIEGEEKEASLNVIERLMMLGADLDFKNRYGTSARDLLEDKPEDLAALIKKCEDLKPVYNPSGTIQPEIPSNLEHPEIAKKIWKELVPPQGQADTVQGELLRAIEKLRDEAQRNGNINHDLGHQLLAHFISNKLLTSGLFDKAENKKIKSSIRKLMVADLPYLDDDIYDYLTDKAVIFYLENDNLIKHEHNPDLWR